MASAITLTVNNFPNGRHNDFNTVTISGKIAIAAGTYPALGLPITWTGIDPPAENKPRSAQIYSVSSGYIYRWDPVNQTIRIFQSAAAGAPLQEIATTTPAGVVADTIYFDAVFNRAQFS